MEKGTSLQTVKMCQRARVALRCRFIKEEQGNETTNNNEGQQERKKKSTIMQEDWLDQTGRNQVIDLSDG